MAKKIAEILLKLKSVYFILLLIFAVFLIPQIRHLKIDYGVPKLLSEKSSSYQSFQKFKTTFGEEKSVLLLGIEKDPFEDLKLLKEWTSLAHNIDTIKGVSGVLSSSYNLRQLEKDTSLKQIRSKKISLQNPSLQQGDSLRNQLHKMPFYKNRIYNQNAHMMLVELDNQIFNSPKRDALFSKIEAHKNAFIQNTSLQVYHSGLPRIKDVMRKLTQKDFIKFVLLSFVISFLILFLIFRSTAPVLASLMVISLSLCFSLGLMVLLGVKVSILTGVVPALIIVIGVPNCIYLINYFLKQRAKGLAKDEALKSMIEDVGLATLLTNFTTAIGFFAFYFTESAALREFGWLAALNVMCLYMISMGVIPFMLSLNLKAAPIQESTRFVSRILDYFSYLITHHKGKIMGGFVFCFALSLIGINSLKVSGNLTDDIPKNHTVFDHIRWFESQLGGIMPLEIVIDAKKPKKVEHYTFLKKLSDCSDSLFANKNLSKPMHIGEGSKFIKQAFYNNNPEKYTPINARERLFIAPYLKFDSTQAQKGLDGYVNTDKSITRMSMLVKDLRFEEMEALLEQVNQILSHYFDPEKYDALITGTSVVFLKGTKYLTQNLLQSILLAIAVISLLMAILFKSARIIFIAVITNLIPLVLTGGFMGLLQIPIKPSTILVFSIAFGISVDDSIHFLAKYKIALNTYSNKKELIMQTIKEVGSSMIYTSIALFLGFIVFIFSDFEGTKALGFLLSFTLIVAMLANLLFLPSLLILFTKEKTS